MQRVAVVFDNTLRPETTGVYCRRGLGELVTQGVIAEVEHLLPAELESLPPDRFDLFLFVDDGLEYDIPPQCRPAAWWAIDTHLSFERCLAKARQADWTFAAQRDGAEQLRQAGIDSAVWLPLACDPVLHAPAAESPSAKHYDLAFIGHIFPGPREELLRQLQQRVPNMFIGNAYFQEMASLYAQSKVVFNRSLRSDLNMRVFEALCSGSLLLTNDLAENGQSELFTDGRHLATYRDADELFDKLEYYLAHEEARERIAAQGRAEVLARHTYRHRMQRLLEEIVAQPRTSRSQPSNAAVVPAKSAPYFEHARPDVLELVPHSARRVLDIGCGSGRLGAALKRRQPAHVTGLELNPDAAAQARQVLDAVQVLNIEQECPPFPEGTFDCVICADILEHLRNPEPVLQQIRRWLTPDGTLITSLPNVRHLSVVQSLLAGNWTYEAAGLLDDDHIRFFTRREIEKLLDRTGFRVDDLRMVPGEGFQDWVDRGRPRQLRVGNLELQVATSEEAAEFFAYQYLARSRPVQRPEYGLTSIILVTHNQWAYTQGCLESLRRRTDEHYELIIVDNGSTDGTPEFLRGWGIDHLIVNETNRGFPAAVNQGIAVARGEQVLLLNNDTLVTTGWLRRMLEVLRFDPEIGLVGPVTNRISGEQQVDVSYQQLADLDGFAWDWGKQHGHELVATDRLVGFCLLIRRSVIDAIGGLDERFGIGNFEDDDFCRRALQAGYKGVIARGAFIHHFGSVTFQGSGLDFAGLLQQNQRLYEEKWNANATPEPAASASPLPPDGDTPARRPRSPFVLARSETGGLRLQPNTIRLSVCLIVRDNERTIGPCLDSIRPWVDEIVVVDTGSTDRTPEICEQLGARVFHWPWRDSFAAARNVSFAHARGEWLFWMDSDDTIPLDCGRQLRELVDGPHPDHLFGYVMQVHCPGRDPQDVTIVDHVKLIRNRPDLEFEFRIHEQVLPSIRRAGGEVGWTDIHVIHSGAEHTPDVHARKLQRDFRLLELELQDRPDHPFTLFNLGMTHADAGQQAEAIRYLQRCLQVSPPEDSHVRKAYALLIGSQMQSRHPQQAWQTCQAGLQLFPDDKELLFRRAMLLHEFGHLAEAEQTYLRILNEPVPRQFASVDIGITTHKARHNLAVVYEDLGRMDEAKQRWQEVLQQHPDYEPARTGLQRLLTKLAQQSEHAASATAFPLISTKST